MFDRKGRSARLNRSGQQVLQRAQDLLRQYDRLGSASEGEAVSALVTIGAIASTQRTLLPDALARFHRRCPGCRSRVIPGLSMELVNRVDAGEVDLGVIIRPPFALQADLQWTTLLREPFCLIAPRDLPGTDWAELLASRPFVRYDRSSFGGRQVDRFLRGMHIAVREVCEVDELEAIVKLVENGVGVALVPQTAAHRHWPDGVRAIDLAEQTFHREIGLVHRVASGLSAPVRVLAGLIEDLAQDRAPSDGDA